MSEGEPGERAGAFMQEDLSHGKVHQQIDFLAVTQRWLLCHQIKHLNLDFGWTEGEPGIQLLGARPSLLIDSDKCE